MTDEEKFVQTVVRLRDSIVSNLGEMVIVQIGNLNTNDPERQSKSVIRVHINTTMYTVKVSFVELLTDPEALGEKIARTIFNCRFEKIFEAEISE